jgi:predicted Fe-Mo cluster-binding NifX family protein
MKIVFPTNDWKGLEDSISEVFAKAETFTIIDYDIKNKIIKKVLILNNDAKTFSHGAGPVAVKILLDYDVNFVGLHEIGVGSMGLLDEKGIRYVKLRSGIKVEDALEVVLKKIFKG